MLGAIQVPLDPQSDTIPMRHMYIISSNFTTSVIFRITRSEAKIFKFDVNLLLIKRNDFFRANMDNFTSYAEHAGQT